MTLRRAFLGWLLVAAAGSLSCGGGAAALGVNDDGGILSCSSDNQCGGGLVCVANVCVPRATSIANLAIEIDPPLSSGAAPTELPAADRPVASLVLTADSELDLVLSFTTPPTNASALMTLPSLIPGRPDLLFQASLTSGQAPMLSVPLGSRGRHGTFSLVPLSPADQSNPPSSFDLAVPTSGATLVVPDPDPPSASYVIQGVLQDALQNGLGGFVARAFQTQGSQSVLVSTRSLTAENNPGSAAATGTFILLLPPTFGGNPITAAQTTVQLTPVGNADPWFTLKPFMLTAGSTKTNLGDITLPVYSKVNSFEVTVHGSDPMEVVAGATVRAFTSLSGGDPRGAAGFLRDATSDATGVATLMLIPGDSNVARMYTLSIVPPPASIWATTCMDNVPVSWNGTAASPVPLLDVALVLRPVLTGTVLASNGTTPIANVVVTATRGSAATPPCLSGPVSTSVATDDRGVFTLPLDPGTYELDYDPPSGSSTPRLTEYPVTISNNDLMRPVRLPAPVVVDGDVVDATQQPLPNATIRMFEAGTTGLVLRAVTQSDDNGHFRAVVAAPPVK